MGVKVEFQGLEKLEIALRNASDKAIKQSQMVVKNTAEKGKRIAKQKAPKDTRFLTNNVNTYHQGIDSVIHSEAGYSGYQEYGTRFQPGTPFMRPMLEEIKPQFEKDLADVMRGAFK